jgi:hypothetical protein
VSSGLPNGRRVQKKTVIENEVRRTKSGGAKSTVRTKRSVGVYNRILLLTNMLACGFEYFTAPRRRRRTLRVCACLIQHDGLTH